MTDKQIIFKCDVNCIRKNTEECFELDCIKGQESILKQLQTKEQECKNNKTAYQMELDIYNQECLNLQEELKETLDKLDQLKAERDSYIDKYFLESQKVLKLNKVLKEIKELCQKHIKAEKIVMANDILQKISEVEDETINN